MEVSVLPSQENIDRAAQAAANERNKRKRQADLRSLEFQGCVSNAYFREFSGFGLDPIFVSETFQKALKTALQQLRQDERFLEAQQVCGWPIRIMASPNSPLELPQKSG